MSEEYFSVQSDYEIKSIITMTQWHLLLQKTPKIWLIMTPRVFNGKHL